MDESNPEFVYLIPAFIGVFGVIIGALISGLTNWFLIKREAKIRIHEKLFERRISAYERVIEFGRLMNSVIQTDRIGEDGYAVTLQGFLQDQEHFDKLILELYKVSDPLLYLLDVQTIQELNYIQDYLGTLNNFLENKDDTEYKKYAEILCPDFRELVNKLEKSANSFFESDINSMNLKPKKGYPKLSVQELQSRFEKTQLSKLLKS